MSLRDRLLTPPVARAIMSPSGILLAGAGASAAILGGIPLLAAAGVGALAWAARVALAVPRTPKAERIDPFTLGEPWRQYVREALQAQARYGQAVHSADAGPLRERLAEIGARIDDGVRECWRIARRGDALDGALGAMDIASTQRELTAVEQDRHRGWGDASSLDRTAESIRAQLGSAQRMVAVANEARDRLRLLDARLDEAVARAIELSLHTGSDVDLTGLGTDVDRLVEDMESLRTALEETSALGAGPGRVQGGTA